MGDKAEFLNEAEKLRVSMHRDAMRFLQPDDLYDRAEVSSGGTPHPAQPGVLRRNGGRNGARPAADPQIAHRYDVNANLIFKWVRDPRYGSVAENQPGAANFLPIEVM